MNIIQRIIARAIGFPFEQPRGSPEWVGATVRSSDIVAGRSIGTGPGGAFVARATQYVLTCATLNARNCAAIPLRLVRRKSATRVSPFGSAPSSPFKSARARERRRKFYTDPRMVGRKAADYAAYGDDIEEVPEHDVIDLLQRPNPYMTGTDMDELAYLTLELCGNAYEYVHGEGEPQEIYPMRAPYVRVIPSEDGFIAGYQYARDTSDPMIVGREMVMHYQHTPNPADPFYGIGPLHAVPVEADIAQAAALSEHYRWQNGSRPDYAVKITSPATTTQIEQIRAEVSRWHRGIKKTGTPAVMANAEIVDLGFAPKDMEYLNGIKVSNEAIWNAFGVPQSLLNLNDANLASSTTGHGQYNRQTVMPRVAKRAMYLTEFLLPRYGINPGEMWFAPDNPEGDDDVMDADRLTKLVQAGVMTVNEARSELGLPPVDEPGASVLGGVAAPSDGSNPFTAAIDPFAQAMNPFAKAITEATRLIAKNCGTGAGGFQPGNDCAGDGSAGSLDDVSQSSPKSDHGASVIDQWSTPATGSREGDYTKIRDDAQRWAGGEKNKGFDALYKETQGKLKKAGITSVKAYRGVDLPPDHPISRGIANGTIKAGDEVKISGRGVASWSERPGVAQSFTDTIVKRYGRMSGKESTTGVVLERVHPSPDIVTGHRFHSGFIAGESEIVSRTPEAYTVRIHSVYAPKSGKSFDGKCEGDSCDTFDLSETRYQRGIAMPPQGDTDEKSNTARPAGVSPAGTEADAEHALGAKGDHRQMDGQDGGGEPVGGQDANAGGGGVRVDVPRGLKFYGRFGERLAHKALMHGETEELAKIRAEFEDELTDWFRKFIKQVVESEGVGVALAASDVAALSDKLDEMAREYIARMSKVGLNDAAAALSLGFDVKPLSSLVFLETYVPKLVDAVTSDTAVAVRDAIAAGMNEGMTIPQITGEIQKEIPGIAQYRAERIARTEASHAYTRGRVDTWKQAGIEKKEWLLGGNPCQVCLDIAAANPDPIPMDRPFYTGDFFGTGNSPAHPNCTCTVAPVLSDEQGEST